jgi:LuxR family quorum-sensing transcriptional regulator LasR
MLDFDWLYRLTGCDRESAWTETLQALAKKYEFNLFFYTINSGKQASLSNAYVNTNFPENWLQWYETKKFREIDPILRHCISSVLPLVWDAKNFKTSTETQLYEAGCEFGLNQGVTFPVHGPNGEFGYLTLIPGKAFSKNFQQKINSKIADWSLIRDYVFKSSLRFSPMAIDEDREETHLTARELECLTLAAEGKSSWEIAEICGCAEATVNFHFTNVRRKFDVNSRQQAIVIAMQSGLISPGNTS